MKKIEKRVRKSEAVFTGTFDFRRKKTLRQMNVFPFSKIDGGHESASCPISAYFILFSIFPPDIYNALQVRNYLNPM